MFIFSCVILCFAAYWESLYALPILAMESISSVPTLLLAAGPCCLHRVFWQGVNYPFGGKKTDESIQDSMQKAFPSVLESEYGSEEQDAFLVDELVYREERISGDTAQDMLPCSRLVWGVGSGL
uniref:Uncharacterized protein n=1 Tax=Aegilops tauschii subsp. strangulata TaxID=200361 RepID=A0A453AWV8_AEGTS